MAGVPVVDISPWFSGNELMRGTVAREFGTACREWGFLIIKGHNIAPSLKEAIRNVTYSFFDLTIEEKMRYSAAGRAGARGYHRMESRSLARTLGVAKAPGDLRETFYMGMEPNSNDPYTDAPAAQSHFAANIWPAQPAEMQSIWEQYFAACNALAVDLFRICASALNLPENWFDKRINRPISTIAAQHYPKLARLPEPGQIRSGAHTDFGTLTLLMTEDRPGGLQVMGADNEWHDVKPLPGAYIVNLGDMMAQWTNDQWRSTLHRVVNPPLDAGDAARRLSIVFFHSPNYDTLIECIPSCTDSAHPPHYLPVQAGAHLIQKHRQADSVKRAAL
jgi:isopenicillin N synthase-like dioxygenase